MFRLSVLLREAKSLLLKDPIIVVPYIFFSFMVSFGEQFFPTIQKNILFLSFMYRFLLYNWFIEVFIIGLTVSMALFLVQKQKIEFSSVRLMMKGRYIHLLLTTFITVFPGAVFSYFFLVSFQNKVPMDPLGYILVPVLLLGNFFFYFSPIIVISKGYGCIQALKGSVRIVRASYRRILLYLSFVIGISMMVFMGASVVSSVVPVLGDVILVLAQGLLLAIIYIINVLFYLKYCTENQVSTVA